jgi:UDP-glucose:(heptosyl)LPS alpha-1,3-glucosyltransferase
MKTGMNKKSLKVAILIRHYDSSGGGAERYCVELTKRLAKIHKVHVFTQHNAEHAENITFHNVPQWFKKPRYVNQLFFSWLTKRATKNKFDIVHSHDMATHANIYTLHVPCVRTKWTQSKGIRKILRWANTLLSPRKIAYLWLEFIEMQALKNRHFISVSEYLSRNILQNYPKLSKHITIAHPGINIHSQCTKNTITCSFVQDLIITNNTFMLLFVGNDLIKKGLPTVLQALKKLNNNNIHLLVAGNNNKSQIKIPSQLENNIHFLGVINNMNALYSQADALVHPTLVDTYGMVVLEAMSMRLPVIVSSKQYCGFTEHLNEKQALILNNPKDINDLSIKINQLYENTEYRNEIAENGFKKSQTISWENTLKNTLLAYNIVIKKRGGIYES